MDKREFHSVREINREVYFKIPMRVVYKHPNPVIRWIANRRIKEIKKIVDNYRVNHKKCILDLGCEEAYFFDNLKDNSFRVGVDFLNEPLKSVKKCVLIQADAHMLPFKDRSFDIVVCSELLEHVIHPEIVLTEINRICKGLVVITFPNDALVIKLKRLFRFSIGKLESGSLLEHLHIFNLEEIKSLLREFIDIHNIKMIPNKLINVTILISGFSKHIDFLNVKKSRENPFE